MVEGEAAVVVVVQMPAGLVGEVEVGGGGGGGEGAAPQERRPLGLAVETSWAEVEVELLAASLTVSRAATLQHAACQEQHLANTITIGTSHPA